MTDLGNMIKIDNLHEVWKNEAHDFTKWVAKNLNFLGTAVGKELQLEEKENSDSFFSSTIFAIEKKTGIKVVIENQLESADCEHLGKIISYASYNEASIIIWIVKKAQEEHRNAIEWLNNKTQGNVGFFLLEIELWKIDDSRLAPKFNIIECPEDWSKSINELTATEEIQSQFWEAFSNYAFDVNNTERMKGFEKRKLIDKNTYDLTAEEEYAVELTINPQKNWITAGLYISSRKGLFEKLEAHKIEIERFIGEQHIFEWTKNPESRILIRKIDVELTDKKKWEEYFSWLCEYAEKFRDVAKKYETNKIETIDSEESEIKAVEANPFIFSVKDGVATIWAFNDDNVEDLEIPSSIDWYPFKLVRSEAQKRGVVASLQTEQRPDAVKYIYDSAFKGCSSLKSVKIPRSVKAIGFYAFERCTNLESILIPRSVEEMEEEVFKDCDKVVLKVFKDSYAHEYAKENNLKFELIGD